MSTLFETFHITVWKKISSIMFFFLYFSHLSSLTYHLRTLVGHKNRDLLDFV